MIELREGQKLRRFVKIYGVEGSCFITLTREGIEYRVLRAKSGFYATHAQVVAKMPPLENTPAWLADDPIKALNYRQSKISKRRIEKEGNR